MKIMKDANHTLKQRCEATRIVHFIETDLSNTDMGRGVVMNREGKRKVATAITDFVKGF